MTSKPSPDPISASDTNSGSTPSTLGPAKMAAPMVNGTTNTAMLSSADKNTHNPRAARTTRVSIGLLSSKSTSPRSKSVCTAFLTLSDSIVVNSSSAARLANASTCVGSRSIDNVPRSSAALRSSKPRATTAPSTLSPTTAITTQISQRLEGDSRSCSFNSWRSNQISPPRAVMGVFTALDCLRGSAPRRHPPSCQTRRFAPAAPPASPAPATARC